MRLCRHHTPYVKLLPASCRAMVFKLENNLEDLLKHKFLDPTPKGSEVGGLRWGLRIFLSDRCPSCADAASLETTRWVALLFLICSTSLTAWPRTAGPHIYLTGLPGCQGTSTHSPYLGLPRAPVQLVFCVEGRGDRWFKGTIRSLWNTTHCCP